MMKIKLGMRKAVSMLIVMAMLLATPITMAVRTYAATGVKYINEDGETATTAAELTVTEISSDMTILGAAETSTWYVVSEDVTVTGLTVNGDVHLILADGCNLTVSSATALDKDNTLSIYAQSVGNNMGRANFNGQIRNVNNTYYRPAIGSQDGEMGILNIYGGYIVADAGAGNYAAGIGGGYYVSGGGSRWRSTNAGTINITGGIVIASGGQDGRAGIGAGYAYGTTESINEQGVLTIGEKAVVKTSGFSGYTEETIERNGIIFDGNTGTVYSDTTITADLPVNANETLTIPADITLTVDSGATVQNSGTINLNGNLTGNGVLLLTGNAQMNGEGIVADSIDYKLGVSKNETNITISGAETATYKTAYTASLSADNDYILPDEVAVTVGNATLISGEGYTYNNTSGKLTIYADQITAPIVISAAGISVNNAVKQLNSTVAELEEAIENGDADLAQKIEKLIEDIATVEAEYKMADSSLKAEIEQIIETAKGTLERAIGQVQTNLDTAVADLEKAIADGDLQLSNKIDDLNKAITDAKSAYEAADATLNMELTALQASMTAADNALNKAVTELQSRITAAEEKIEVNAEEIAKLKESLATAQAAIESLKAFNNSVNSVVSIQKTATSGLIDTYTITYTDGSTSTFTVTNGKDGVDGIKGDKGNDGHTPVITIQNGNWHIDGVNTNVKAEGVKGDTGNGISSITKTNTSGLVDTYTITYTDGSTSTFTVTNGKDGVDGIKGDKGDDGHTPVITIQNGNWYIDGVDSGVVAIGVKGDTGNGISKIEKTGSEGVVDTYTITFTDGTTTTFTVTNGEDGKDGADGDDGAAGVGIAKVEKTATNGNVDTYTITLTNGNTYTFTVTNGNSGSNGANGVDGKDGITPQLRINEVTNMWEVSYDNGKTWTSLGVKATGENGKDGADGKDGVDGKDGLTPFIGENGNWWIGDTDTGVQAVYEGSIPASSSAVVDNNSNNTITIIAIVIACLALASNIAVVTWVVTKKKKSLV